MVQMIATSISPTTTVTVPHTSCIHSRGTIAARPVTPAITMRTMSAYASSVISQSWNHWLARTSQCVSDPRNPVMVAMSAVLSGFRGPFPPPHALRPMPADSHLHDPPDKETGGWDVAAWTTWTSPDHQLISATRYAACRKAPVMAAMPLSLPVSSTFPPHD